MLHFRTEGTDFDAPITIDTPFVPNFCVYPALNHIEDALKVKHIGWSVPSNAILKKLDAFAQEYARSRCSVEVGNTRQSGTSINLKGTEDGIVMVKKWDVWRIIEEGLDGTRIADSDLQPRMGRVVLKAKNLKPPPQEGFIPENLEEEWDLICVLVKRRTG